MKAEPTIRRAIRIVSQCASAEEFLAVFHPYIERDALFIATGSPEEPGAQLRFVMTLASGEPMMRGGAVVLESHRDRSNFYGLRGMKVRFDDLDEGSRQTLARLESGPSRRAQSSPGVGGAGRRPAEVVECLIFEEPGTEAADPVSPAGRGVMDSGGGGDGEGLPLSVDDDVTAVAPPPRPREAGEPPPTLRERLPPRFIVPAPQSDPGIVPLDRGAIDDVTATDRSAPRPVLADQPASGNGAPAGHAAAPAPEVVMKPRGKSGATGQAAAVVRPAPEPPSAPPDPGLSRSVFELGAISAPPARRDDDGGSGPVLSQAPTMRINPALPPQHMPRAPSHPPEMGGSTPAFGMPTPTEIVSPLALRSRTSKPPLPPERTELVRVGQLRTAAVSATIGALLGLGAGYLLWGLEHEARRGTAPLVGDAAPKADPAPAQVVMPDGGGGGTAAAGADGGAGGAAPKPGGKVAARVLKVVSVPAGAEVVLDGRRAGVTPFELPLGTQAQVEVTVRKQGFRPWSKALQGDDLDTTLEVVLRRVPPKKHKK